MKAAAALLLCLLLVTSTYPEEETSASVDYSLFRSSNMSSLLSKIKTAETEGVPKGPETRNLFSDIFNFFGDILKTILPKPAAGDKKGSKQSGADYKYLSDAALPTLAPQTIPTPLPATAFPAAPIVPAAPPVVPVAPVAPVVPIDSVFPIAPVAPAVPVGRAAVAKSEGRPDKFFLIETEN